MATEIKAFKCDWCPRCFTRRNNAELHEAACKNNPKRRQCITCVHGTVDELKIPTPRPWRLMISHHNDRAILRHLQDADPRKALFHRVRHTRGWKQQILI